jgi:transposase
MMWQLIAALCLSVAAIGILVRINRSPKRCGHCGRMAVVKCKCHYCHNWTFGGL